MSAVLLHIALGGCAVIWAGTGDDPLIILACYAFGLVFIDGPPRSA